MKRPMLISGITITLISALLTTFSKSVPVIVIAGASVFVFSLILKKLKKDTFIISFISIVAILTAIVFSVFTYIKITPCLKYHNTTTYIQGKITSTPIISDGNYIFTLKADKIGSEEVNQSITVAIPSDNTDEIKLYDYLYLGDARLAVPVDDRNNFDFSEIADGTLLNAFPKRIISLKECNKTPYYYCLKLKETINLKVNTSMSDGNAGLLSGMLFGDKAGIDYDTAKAFRNSGIAHLLAVSGLHTALWCGMLLSLLKILRAGNKVGVFVCILFLTGFCTVSAFTPSVIRASIMTGCAMLAPLVKRRADSFNSLGLAVTVLLILNPYTVHNISFQLSAAATLGVLFSVPYTQKIFTKFKDIPIKQIRSFTLYILSSIIVSLFSGIFTLPVSAYHFGVVTLLSPIANILCVKPAFYGMISGTIATTLSFIPTTATKSLSLALFDATEFILDLVEAVAKLISRIPFCTIPVHQKWLITGIIICSVIFVMGFVIYKFKVKKLVLRATAITVVLALFICILVPIISPEHKNTLTIISAGDNLCFIVRSGTHYALLTNTKERLPSDIHNYLPKATGERLDYYIATYLTNANLYSLETTGKMYSPTETRITKVLHTMCETTGVTPPPNTIIQTNDKYALSEEITFEIIDTNQVQYAIIKSKEKTAVVHIFGDTEIHEVANTENADIFVFNSNVPQLVKANPDTIIISSGSRALADKSRQYLTDKCNNLYFTAKDGTIQIDL